MSFSNGLVALFNLVTAILSLPIIAASYLLYQIGDVECERLLLTPFVALGVYLFLLSIFGLIGSCCRSTFLMWIYLFLLLLLITLLCSFMAYAFALATKPPDAPDGSNTNLNVYSIWVRDMLNDKANWGRIQSCLKSFNVCPAMYNPSFLADVRLYYDKALAPIQNGCCMPPAECGYVHKGTFAWTAPAAGFTSSNTDCIAWSNEEDTLCYKCDSCKAGFLARLDRDVWKKLSIYSTLLLVLLILIYSVGCCALHDTRHRQHRRYNNVRY